MASTATENFTSVQEIMLEFRAGRMFMEGTRVRPDSRKGLVRIGRGDEGLIHFQWLDRNQNIVEEDQIVFPEEAVFEKVSQSSDRVYILKFKSDSRRFFFWMQEPKSDGDLQICNLVNIHINQPFADAVEEEAEASIPLQTSEMSEDTAEEEISSRAGNVIEPSLTSSSLGDITSPSGPVQLAELQRILSSIGSSDETLNHDEGLGLGDILRPDLLLPLMDDLCIEQKLASYLPEGSWTQYEVIELLQSPQLRQQLEAFTSVLRSGQIDLSQFGINPSKYKFTVLSFLEALEDSVSSSSEAETDVRRGDSKDLDSHMCNANDPMDEGQ